MTFVCPLRLLSFRKGRDKNTKGSPFKGRMLLPWSSQTSRSDVANQRLRRSFFTQSRLFHLNDFRGVGGGGGNDDNHFSFLLWVTDRCVTILCSLGVYYRSRVNESEYLVFAYSAHRTVSIWFCIVAVLMGAIDVGLWVGSLSRWFLVWDAIAVVGWLCAAVGMIVLRNRNEALLREKERLGGRDGSALPPSSAEEMSASFALREQMRQNAKDHEKWLLVTCIACLWLCVGMNGAQESCNYVVAERRIVDCREAINTEGLLFLLTLTTVYLNPARLILLVPLFVLWGVSFLGVVYVTVPDVIPAYFQSEVSLVVCEMVVAIGTLFVRERSRRRDFELHEVQLGRADELALVREDTKRLLAVQLPVEVAAAAAAAGGGEIPTTTPQQVCLRTWKIFDQGVVAIFRIEGIAAWSACRGPCDVVELLRVVFDTLDSVWQNAPGSTTTAAVSNSAAITTTATTSTSKVHTLGDEYSVVQEVFNNMCFVRRRPAVGGGEVGIDDDGIVAERIDHALMLSRTFSSMDLCLRRAEAALEPLLFLSLPSAGGADALRTGSMVTPALCVENWGGSGGHPKRYEAPPLCLCAGLGCGSVTGLFLDASRSVALSGDAVNQASYGAKYIHCRRRTSSSVGSTNNNRRSKGSVGKEMAPHGGGRNGGGIVGSTLFEDSAVVTVSPQWLSMASHVALSPEVSMISTPSLAAIRALHAGDADDVVMKRDSRGGGGGAPTFSSSNLVSVVVTVAKDATQPRCCPSSTSLGGGHPAVACHHAETDAMSTAAITSPSLSPPSHSQPPRNPLMSETHFHLNDAKMAVVALQLPRSVAAATTTPPLSTPRSQAALVERHSTSPLSPRSRASLSSRNGNREPKQQQQQQQQNQQPSPPMLQADVTRAITLEVKWLVFSTFEDPDIETRYLLSLEVYSRQHLLWSACAQCISFAGLVGIVGIYQMWSIDNASRDAMLWIVVGLAASLVLVALAFAAEEEGHSHLPRWADTRLSFLSGLRVRDLVHLGLCQFCTLSYAVAVFVTPSGSVIGNSQLVFLFILLNWSIMRPAFGVRPVVLWVPDAMLSMAFLMRTFSRPGIDMSRLSLLYAEWAMQPFTLLVRLLIDQSRRKAFAVEWESDVLKSAIERDNETLKGLADLIAPRGSSGHLIRNSLIRHRMVHDAHRRRQQRHRAVLLAASATTDGGADSHRTLLHFRGGGDGDAPASPSPLTTATTMTRGRREPNDFLASDSTAPPVVPPPLRFANAMLSTDWSTSVWEVPLLVIQINPTIREEEGLVTGHHPSSSSSSLSERAHAAIRRLVVQWVQPHPFGCLEMIKSAPYEMRLCVANVPDEKKRRQDLDEQRCDQLLQFAALASRALDVWWMSEVQSRHAQQDPTAAAAIIYRMALTCGPMIGGVLGQHCVSFDMYGAPVYEAITLLEAAMNSDWCVANDPCDETEEAMAFMETGSSNGRRGSGGRVLASTRFLHLCDIHSRTRRQRSVQNAPRRSSSAERSGFHDEKENKRELLIDAMPSAALTATTDSTTVTTDDDGSRKTLPKQTVVVVVGVVVMCQSNVLSSKCCEMGGKILRFRLLQFLFAA